MDHTGSGSKVSNKLYFSKKCKRYAVDINSDHNIVLIETDIRLKKKLNREKNGTWRT